MIPFLLKNKFGPLSTRQILQHRLRVLVCASATIIALHVLAMVLFESMTLGESLWLTLTTITTVGYGDLSASSGPGRFSTVILLYIGGIYMVTLAIGAYFEYQTQKTHAIRYGYWEWEMRDHILLLNVPTENTIWYLCKLAQQIRATHTELSSKQIMVVSERFEKGMPQELVDAGFYYKNATPNSLKALKSAYAEHASHVIAFSSGRHSNLSDAEVFDLVHRVREISKKVMIVAEIVEDINRQRVLDAGANLVVRPIRGYPEMLARAIIAPGAEGIIEQVFTSGGDECVRYELTLEKVRWSTIVNLLVEEGIGLPLAYRDAEHTTINPDSNTLFNCDALFVLVKEHNMVDRHKLETIIRRKLMNFA